MKKLYALSFSLFLAANCLSPTISFAGVIGNDTTITINQIPLINGTMSSTVTVIFPDTNFKYEQILLHYSLTMPSAGWDPYDRIGDVTSTKNGQSVEIARIMTPFSKACGWTVDVTDFRPVLAGSIDLSPFILYYVTSGSQKGYLVNISFDFKGGNPKKEAYKIQNLWDNNVLNDRWEYGCYIHKISDSIAPKQITIDAGADSVKVNVNMSGHGEFNTDNCGEFCSKLHSLRIDSNYTFNNTLWRSDCGSNPCSPQSGTWQYNRAGWCPGSQTNPWKVDITQYAPKGNTIWIEYWPQQYHNFCSPDDSSCASNVANNCNPYYSTYGSGCAYTNGHTQPFFFMHSQIIYYKNLLFASGVNEISDNKLRFTVFPNPSLDGEINVQCSGITNAKIELLNELGQVVFSTTMNREQQTIVPKVENGLYMLKISEGIKTGMKKIMLLSN
ncbi:MAG: T9SS type A sorting domain-containing protein [Bacteroidetes bacterium]|nr:T9SS type A sorting domain-containing protein [Bacteroidota bacterium]